MKLKQVLRNSRKLEAAIRSLAKAHPDKIGRGDDGSCVYFDFNGQPSCIIGHAFNSFGVDPNEVLEDNEDDIKALYGFNNVPGPVNLNWIRMVQEQQDYGLTWGEAVERADSYCGLTNTQDKV